MDNFKYITEAICKDTCAQLTKFLQESTENNAAIKDEQCPNSFSVYHDPVLERVLEEFLPRMEQETGKKLFPTYAYARFYLEGEELLCHTDREACEYSVTITLGHDGEVWPLYIADLGQDTDLGIKGQDEEIHRVKNQTKLDIAIGDGVIYKGCDAPHWREVLKDGWQTQIFLHYVDQNGPYAEWKYDKRPALSHHQNSEVNEEIVYWFARNAIADIACEQMIHKFEQIALQPAKIGANVMEGVVEKDVRNVDKLSISHEIGIGATLSGIGLNMNQKAWKFDITNSNQTEYLRYSTKGHYVGHVDTFMAPNSLECRKLTILAFLNNDFEGGKFFLQVGDSKIYPEQEKGTVIAFPSFILHGVEPVTKGIRRSIVTWLCGPWFK